MTPVAISRATLTTAVGAGNAAHLAGLHAVSLDAALVA